MKRFFAFIVFIILYVSGVGLVSASPDPWKALLPFFAILWFVGCSFLLSKMWAKLGWTKPKLK